MKILNSLAILLCLTTAVTAGDQVILTVDPTLKPSGGATLRPDYSKRENVWPGGESPAIEVELKRGDTFSIQINGVNKLLYNYTFSDVKSEPTDNAKAVTELLEALKEFDAALGTKTGEAKSEGAETAGAEIEDNNSKLNLDNLKSKHNELKKRLKEIEDLTEKSNTNMIEVQNHVANWKLKDDQKWFNDLRESLESIIQEPIPEDLDPKNQLDEIEENKKKIYELYADGVIDADEEAILKHYKDSNTRNKEEINKKTSKYSVNIALTNRAHQVLTLLNSQRPDIDEAFKLLEAFQKEVAAADKLEPMKPIHYSATNKQTITLTIANPKKIDNPHWKGTLIVTVVPLERFNFKIIKPAVVYSFIQTDTYGTKPVDVNSETKHQVTLTESEYNEYAVGAFWQVKPKTWDGDDLSGSIDMGFAYDKKLGAVLGGSVSFLRRTSIGMGIIAQQVDVLGAGINVGDNLNLPTDLKLDKKFKTGFYLGINIEMGK